MRVPKRVRGRIQYAAIVSANMAAIDPFDLLLAEEVFRLNFVILSIVCLAVAQD